MTAPHELFASCAPGLEPLLEAELATLGALDPKKIDGGVAFRGHRGAIYRANLESGIATHVLLRIARFEAARFDQLERQVRGIEWGQYLKPGVPREIRVTARKSRLHHTGAIAERVEREISRQLGDPPKGDGAVPIGLRFVHDRVLMSIDTSGAPLHRRGYRVRSGPAPLREDLAHALILASGWDRDTALIDPLCGTGTIAIEAAGLARRMAPGRLRGFAFERTPLLHEPTWSKVRAASEARVLPEAPALISGFDRDAAAVSSSRKNAEKAGVSPSFQRAVISELPVGAQPAAGALVTNPPYGRRLGGETDLAPLYRSLGRYAAALPDTWKLALMCTDRRLGLRVDSGLSTAFVTDAGGIKVRALCRAAPAEPA